MFRLIVLSLLWIMGLTPTVISLLIMVSMLGQPTRCDRPGCQAKTYGVELLILPIGTGLPFLMGWKIASMRRNKLHWQPPTGKNYHAS